AAPASAEDSWDAQAASGAAAPDDSLAAEAPPAIAAPASAEDSWDAQAASGAAAPDDSLAAEAPLEAHAVLQAASAGESRAAEASAAPEDAFAAGAAPKASGAAAASPQASGGLAEGGGGEVPPVLEPIGDGDAEGGPAAGGRGASGEVLEPTPGVDRTKFLESLMDDSDSVPRKVELDLDGIFDQARKEADELSPDSTHTPVTAPLPQDPDEEEESAQPPPSAPATPRKVSKFKLMFLVVPVALGALGLLFGIYQIFIKSEPPPETPALVISPEALVDTREAVPGELTLGRFLLSLEQAEGEPSAVAELEIILHFHDAADEWRLNANMVILRDAIFRLAKSRGSGILRDPAQRRQLQADLLATLNALPQFRTDQEHQFLTYVQISLLKKV
ncbi:MAG: hypothetical protein LBW85_04665, partial [Deltaproteobacteria bacterium]|nr:hypothetical protein [Deltaproteobacteria bacterium]